MQLQIATQNGTTPQGPQLNLNEGNSLAFLNQNLNEKPLTTKQSKLTTRFTARNNKNGNNKEVDNDKRFVTPVLKQASKEDVEDKY